MSKQRERDEFIAKITAEGVPVEVARFKTGSDDKEKCAICRLVRAFEIGAKVAIARYYHNEYLACRLSRLFKKDHAQYADLLDVFAISYKITYESLDQGGGTNHEHH